MKRIKVIVVFIMMLLITSDCSVAYATETGMVVTAGELNVRQLSQAEMEQFAEEISVENITGNLMAPMATTASYTAYEYSREFDFSLEGRWVACAEAVCIVWHYTDGKVHLYSRTITVERLASFDATRTYGRIVNTDGSLSYTTGDRVRIIDYMDYWDFALDFRVTPTEASFDCYEV